jgi:protein-S-isoprenylcysteine O-methyltransferase Ste14
MTGAYSIARHPIYFGNFFIGLGFALYCASFWVVAVFVLLFWVYYERIMFAEEEFLRRTFGKAYESWAARTPADCKLAQATSRMPAPKVNPPPKAQRPSRSPL